MKKIIVLISAAAALTLPAMAGPQLQSKMVVPAVEYYGIGWYGAIDGGANVYQDSGGTRTFTTTRGHDISISPNQNIGGFGGLKLGYVFGTGFVRPALEADVYYNGVHKSIDVDVDGRHAGSVSGNINTGAFMANSLLRFNFERFQPYLGFGLGYYIADSNDVDVTVTETTRTGRITERTHGKIGSSGDLAWQLVAGADYYFNTKFSAFLEYKFLNYENAFADNAVRQQLVGAGLRFHF